KFRPAAGQARDTTRCVGPPFLSIPNILISRYYASSFLASRVFVRCAGNGRRPRRRVPAEPGAARACRDRPRDRGDRRPDQRDQPTSQAGDGEDARGVRPLAARLARPQLAATRITWTPPFARLARRRPRTLERRDDEPARPP